MISAIASSFEISFALDNSGNLSISSFFFDFSPSAFTLWQSKHLFLRILFISPGITNPSSGPTFPDWFVENVPKAVNNTNVPAITGSHINTLILFFLIVFLF